MRGVLTNSQLDRLSEFTANLGLVFMASIVAPLFSGVDKVDLFMLILGVVFTLLCVVISLWLVRKLKL